MKKLYGVLMALAIVVVAVVGFTAYRRVHVATAGRELGLKCLREGYSLLGLANLIQFGKAEDIPAIVPLLDHTNAHVRFTAARTLASISGHTIPIPSGLSGDTNVSPELKCQVFDLSDETMLADYIAAWKGWAATYTSANKAPEATR